ncbi:NUDIX domain-containing protein [Candidatus Roizmanbacteria bacterium]|nr:NUDIX domain-containing protein [Candidatus Roizmanbacteria bacterium]
MITCFFEDGGKSPLRHVTISVIVIKDGKVLLGKRGTFQGKPILEFGRWALLGGFFNRGEDLIKAAKREVMEESGWGIKNLKLFRVNDSPNRPREDRQNMDMVFTAEALQQTGKSDEEVTELAWFDFAKLPSPDMMAFDHGEDLELYRKYLKENFALPLLG